MGQAWTSADSGHSAGHGSGPYVPFAARTAPIYNSGYVSREGVRVDNIDQPFAAPQDSPRRSGWRLRHSDGIEFDRVIFFTDAVYAIAMTLLIIAVEVPEFDAEGPPSIDVLWHSISEELPALFSFFLGFWLIGRFWMAHHGFFAGLGAVNRTLIGLNLVYLSFIAVLPYPTGLIGNYPSNPLSVVFFAVVLSLVSTMETVMFAYAHRAGLLRRPISAEVFRAGIWQSAIPVVLFLLSIPVAFVSSFAAIVMWILTPVAGLIVDRFSGVRGADVRDQIEG